MRIFLLTFYLDVMCIKHTVQILIPVKHSLNSINDYCKVLPNYYTFNILLFTIFMYINMYIFSPSRENVRHTMTPWREQSFCPSCL